MGNSIKGIFLGFVLLTMVILMTVTTLAFDVRDNKNAIEALEFRVDELAISTSQVPLSEIINQLPNRYAWQSFSRAQKNAFIYIDPRSGRPVSLMYPLPIIPGTGEHNTVTLASLSASLGYKVNSGTKEVVQDIILQHLRQYSSLININMDEIGEIRINNISESVWHIHIKRQYQGIHVQDTNISFAINHGNLVLWGLEKWGDINLNTIPSIDKEYAIEIGFSHIGGRL